MFFGSYPYRVYIVKCSDGNFYTGITTNIERRIRQHNGLVLGGAKYTRSRRPVELVYIKKYKTRKEAAKKEWEIKHTLSRQQKEELICKTKTK